MELHLGNDNSWFEPLKDDTSTPRYKQVSSPRIFVQDEITTQLKHAQARHGGRTSAPSTLRHDNSEPSTPRFQSSEPSTPRHQNSEPSTPRYQNSEPSTPRYVKLASHSAHSSLRSTQYIKSHISSRPLLRHNSSVRSQKLVGSNHWRPSTFDDIREHCLEHGKLYEDPVFPGDESSLHKNTKLNIRNIKWKRPHEIVKNPRFVVNTVCDMAIEQGKLGDCWLVSAFACLSMAPKLLQKCVPLDQGFHDDKYAGIFHFRFWRYGEWIDVVVDDRLPTIDGHILYMRSPDPEEFWPALFEKAYAKLYGSYEHIYGGRVCWALQDITGGITNTHIITDSSRHLITIIDLAMSRASLVGGYISTSVTGNMPGVLLNGLKTGHTYSITGYAEIPVTGGKVILLRLRNPILNVLWNGAWSKRSPHWKVLNEQTREKLKIDQMLDGEFWMSFVDFQKIFTEIEICHLGPESWKQEPGIQHRGIWTSSVAHRQWRKGFNAGGWVSAGVMCNNSQFYVELKKPMAMIVSLMQKYKTKDESKKYQSCTCLIYKVQRGLELRLGEDFFLQNRVYASTKFKQCRENVHTFVLSEGSYIIIPVTEIEGQEGRYMLRFYTAGDSTIRELDDPDGIKELHNNHHMHPEKIHLLRGQFKNITAYSKYEEIDARQLQAILATKSKDKIPLLCCSTDTDVLNFKSLNLSIATCKGAIAIFDNVFRKFAKGNPLLSSFCLRSAIKLSGFYVSSKTLETLVIRYTNHARVSLDEFICMLIKLSIAHNQYQTSGSDNDHLLTQLLQTAIYS